MNNLIKMCGHTFLRGRLAGAAVVDLGANSGDFAEELLKHVDCRVYAVEPVPELFARIPADSRIVPLQACVTDREGPVTLYLPAERCATADASMAANPSVTVPGVTLPRCFERFGLQTAALVKVDIEGAEVPMFETLPPEFLRRAAQWAVEFHDFLYPALRPRVEAIKRRFEANGFYCVPFSFRTNGDVLFVRRDTISRATYWYLRYLARYRFGLGRLVRRVTAQVLPPGTLYSYRKVRLIVKSRLFLPPFVRIVANSRTATLSTRGYPTANVVFWLGTRDVMDYEHNETVLLSKHLKSVKGFWDVGAQIGYYAIVAALHTVPNILAIDIDKRYCKEIQKHSDRNNLGIHVLCSPVGKEGYTVTFKNYAKTTKAKARTFDELATTYFKPDLIKMDIDGGEADALDGAQKLLTGKNPPLLFIEMLPEFEEKLTEKLLSYGYSPIERAGMNVLWKKVRDQ